MDKTFKLSPLVVALSLSLAAGQAMADRNTVTIGGSGGGTHSTIDVSDGTATTVNIFQVGSGDGLSAGELNQVGYENNELKIDGTSTVTIGQGKHVTGDGTFGEKQFANKGNLVTGLVQSGDVRISQMSGGNTVSLVDIYGAGVVTVIQGNATADDTDNEGNPTVAAGGSGFTASVTQTGSGAVTIHQGNSADSKATGGTAAVVHAGSHTVSITQNITTGEGSSVGTVKTNTTGDGGELTVTQTGTGNVFVNQAGDTDNAAAVTIASTVRLNNDGTGTIAVKGAGSTGTTNVYAHISGGDLTINDEGGTGNTIYVNSRGDATAVGTGGQSAGMGSGTLIINGEGTNNTVRVTDFEAAHVTVNQFASTDNSTLNLTAAVGADTTEGYIINQNGAYQLINADIVSGGTITTLNADQSGIAGNLATMNVTM